MNLRNLRIINRTERRQRGGSGKKAQARCFNPVKSSGSALYRILNSYYRLVLRVNIHDTHTVKIQTDSTTQIGSLSNVLSRLSVEVRIDGEDETPHKVLESALGLT